MSESSLSSDRMPQYDNGMPGNYEHYGMVNSYTTVPGVMFLPVAEPPPEDPVERANWSPFVAVHHHAPYQIRRIDFVASKKGAPPVVPSPESSGKFNFMGGSVNIPHPKLNLSTDTFDWRVDGSYTYAVDCAASVSDGYVIGYGPYTLPSQAASAAATSGINPSDLPGPLAAAGQDAQRGYVDGLNLDLNSPYTSFYSTPSYLPSAYLNKELVNGGPGGSTEITPPLPPTA